MELSFINVEPLRQYWARRVALPSLITSLLLLLGVVGIIHYSIITSEQKSMKGATQNLAILVADPILLGDDFELYKRVGALAKRQNLEVLVKDPSGKILTSFPVANASTLQDTTGAEWFSEFVLANDGHLLGKVEVKALSIAPFADWRLPVSATVLFFIFFGLVIWLIQSAQPLREDLVSLADIKSIGTDGVAPPFRFSETANTYELLRQQALELVDAGKAQAMNEVATQVAHDIRAPLAALMAATSNFALLPEEDRTLIRSAITRIRDIANNLLELKRKGELEKGTNSPVSGIPPLASVESKTVEMVQALIESTVSQKRVQYGGRTSLNIIFNLATTPFGVFAELQRTEFHRILSNLIDNSVESFQSESGTVEIAVEIDSSQVKIIVQDDGKGIPDHLLQKVVERGGTYGKKNGNGLGLSHARETVEAWGGSFHIESTVGEGTCITLEIPRVEAPRWFASTLSEQGVEIVVVLDDDVGIHYLWKKRFEKYKSKDCSPIIHHFYSSDEIVKWYRSNLGSIENCLFLCDFELIGSRHSGLDVIEMLGIASRSVLVTGQADEPVIQEKCSRQGIRFLPKILAPFVPIAVGS